MKALRLAAIIAAAATSLSAAQHVALASHGNTQHFGPYASTTPDNGSCGQQWAVDTVNRFFQVQNNGDGTFGVREEFKDGSFVTTGPVSPGACETDSHHGSVLAAGVDGTFHGYLDGTVTSTTYNPQGCSASGADCSTTAGFLVATFGPSGATFTCSLGYAGCRFSFEYAAGGQGLLFHSWKDSGTDGVTEVFRGDIATG